MKTTFDLPMDLIREVKLRSALQGKPVKYLVEDLLRQGLKKGALPKVESIPHESVSFTEKGLPLIRGRSGAPALKMTAEELIAEESEILHAGEMSRGGIPL
jgi:hypothetical protein